MSGCGGEPPHDLLRATCRLRIRHPEHVFCRMMGNDWMDVTKLRQQRHLKHYKGIEFDKESGEFFDFDGVTKEELAEIIEAGGLEVSFFSCLYGQLV